MYLSNKYTGHVGHLNKSQLILNKYIMKRKLYLIISMALLCTVFILKASESQAYALKDKVFCIGEACENANGHTYNSSIDFWGRVVDCCSEASPQRGCKEGGGA